MTTMSNEDVPPPADANSQQSPSPLPGNVHAEVKKIGKYQVVREIGRGGFGIVYQAWDEDAQRDVALKVPHEEWTARHGAGEPLRAEARILSRLDHPHIVPFYGVDRTRDGVIYLVFKFISGKSLAEMLKDAPRKGAGRANWFAESTKWVADIAEALHHAHLKNVFHRDIKPSNILIDEAGKAYLTDFGLAMKEEDFGRTSANVGTLHYLSPEQARREGDRVDGRSDVFSLGIVLYELLTGRTPYSFNRPADDLIEEIKYRPPRPPTQIDDSIPWKLAQICLKAVEKQPKDRYPTARDFAVELREWLRLPQQPPGETASLPSPLPRAKVVPKGLRAFDEADADFFLELLPGAKDKNGLPLLIRDLKRQIEGAEPNQPFKVGVIYGPSGCGKSSLLHAGLLPLLTGHVLVAAIQATPHDTELDLVTTLKNRFSGQIEHLPLSGIVGALCRGEGLGKSQKLLIVLDQFEQWLHDKRQWLCARGEEESEPELVRSLRQCDGERVQCILLIREDFWGSLDGFMDTIKVPLIRGADGENFHRLVFFGEDDALRVLLTFGHAEGRLPEDHDKLSSDQKVFLDQAVKGLAPDGSVLPVQLALFVQMLRNRPWIPATLREIGGAEGVGFTFLEETFSSSRAEPRLHLHEQAVRAVLSALLPEQGTDIKIKMQSHGTLLEASDYARTPHDFEELLGILDKELRLITPTEPVGLNTNAGQGQATGERYYQLTHDYLVHSLWEWLTRKQKETWRGRAELRLAERASSWNAKAENRHLPAWWEWLNIRLLTRRRDWTPSQTKMMRKTGRYHAVRGLALALMLLAVTVAGVVIRGEVVVEKNTSHATGLVNRLLNAKTAQVLDIAAEMDGYRRWTDPLLRQAYQEAEEARDARKQLHASLALLPVDDSQVGYLYGRLLDAQPQEVAVIRCALQPHKDALVERLWGVLGDRKINLDRRLRAACALTKYAPDDARWEKSSSDVVAKLMAENSLVVVRWLDALQPVAGLLLPPLAVVLKDERRSVSDVRTAANIYENLAKNLPDAFAPLERCLSDAPVDATVAWAKRQANIGAALMAMGQGEQVWPLLKHGPDPTLRSFLIERLGLVGVDVRVMATRLDQENEVSIRRAIVLSLGEFGEDRLPLPERMPLIPPLVHLYRDDPDPGIHGAAEWLLRQWKEEGNLKEIDKGLATGSVQGGRQWYVNRQGQTMVVVPRPGEFSMGEDEKKHRRRIDRSYAIASKEVTVEQFLRFRKGHDYDKKASPTKDCPVNNVSWYKAAEYCNWLSEQEGIDEDQWCYLPNAEGQYAKGMKLAPGCLGRAGYRLPTEGGMGICLSSGISDGVVIRECGRTAGQVRRVGCQFVGEGSPRRVAQVERLGPIRHARQRLGMVPRRKLSY